jgi:hypothetical protein
MMRSAVSSGLDDDEGEGHGADDTAMPEDNRAACVRALLAKKPPKGKRKQQDIQGRLVPTECSGTRS